MKNLKMLQAALAIAVLSIVVGCSDQITSSGETGSSKKDEEVKLESTGSKDANYITLFEKSFSLKPGGSIKFNPQSTGLEKLYSVDLINDDITSNDIDICRLVSVYGDLRGGSLGCNRSGFDIKEITVESKSKSVLTLKILLKGIKQKNVSNNSSKNVSE